MIIVQPLEQRRPFRTRRRLRKTLNVGLLPLESCYFYIAHSYDRP